MDSFRARLSNQVPSRWPPVARLEKVLDFWRDLISIPDTQIDIDEIRSLGWAVLC